MEIQILTFHCKKKNHNKNEKNRFSGETTIKEY